MWWMYSYSSRLRVVFITFRVRCSRGEMYIGHDRLCVCESVSLSLAVFPHYCTGPDVTWGMVGVPSSCALLGGFAIGARVSLLWQHSAEREMSASACILASMPGCIFFKDTHAFYRTLYEIILTTTPLLHWYITLIALSDERVGRYTGKFSAPH